MAHITKTFDLYYKRLPTGSISGYAGYMPEFWFTSSISSSVAYNQNMRVSGAFLNYPDDYTGSLQYVTTRNSASNVGYVAFPWGSHAGDFLWNVKTFSWSFADTNGTDGVNNWTIRTWSASYTSKSFHKQFNSGSASTFGVSSYAVTSSWIITDEKVFRIGVDVVYPNYLHSYNSVLIYPTFMGSTELGGSETSTLFGYPMTYPDITSSLGTTATSSIDKQYFDLGGGAAISQTSISASLVVAALSSSTDTLTSQNHLTEALKARRLFFPVPLSGSGTSGGTDYWFKRYTGYRGDEVFDENGGIYNVQFTLKRYQDPYHNYYPNTGSFMTVFIHDVQSKVPFSSKRLPGAAGWYPPANNIVTIGNKYKGTPEFSFYDLQTGFYVERFNVNVIQYGYPAQLCLEASGSLVDDSYFGIIVDELQICKIGVTTDPRFTKPTSITQQVQDTTTKYAIESGAGDIIGGGGPTE
jgi:hypothetical protein